MADQQAWMGKCFIDVAKREAASGNSTDLSLRAITRDVSINMGGRVLNAISMLNDGFIAALENEKKTTISFTGYVTTAGNASGVTVNSIAYLLGLDGLYYESSDSSDPIAVESASVTPTPLRLCFLWTDDTTPTKATAATAATAYALRRTFANGFITTPPSMEFRGDPRVLEFSADFEFAPRNKYGFPNYYLESARAGQLSALNNYNETNYGETVASRTW